MLMVSDGLQPSPQSASLQEERLLNVGGPNFLVNGRHGGFLCSNFDFFLGKALITYGEYGEMEWALLTQLIQPGHTVVEAGAHIGALTVPMARAVTHTGRVIAIEPQRIIHHYLGANMVINGFSHVETHPCGCGAQSGLMAVPYVDYFAEKQNNFGAVNLVKEGQGETVTVRTLDDIVGARPVHLIKIDVEGMEIEVLRGAKRTIRKSRPLLYVENDRASRSEELIRLIQHYDYKLFWHMPLLFNPLNYFGVAENIYGEVRSCNMLCVPSELPMNVAGFQEITNPLEHPAARR